MSSDESPSSRARRGVDALEAITYLSSVAVIGLTYLMVSTKQAHEAWFTSSLLIEYGGLGAYPLARLLAVAVVFALVRALLEPEAPGWIPHRLRGLRAEFSDSSPRTALLGAALTATISSANALGDILTALPNGLPSTISIKSAESGIVATLEGAHALPDSFYLSDVGSIVALSLLFPLLVRSKRTRAAFSRLRAPGGSKPRALGFSLIIVLSAIFAPVAFTSPVGNASAAASEWSVGTGLTEADNVVVAEEAGIAIVTDTMDTSTVEAYDLSDGSLVWSRTFSTAGYGVAGISYSAGANQVYVANRDYKIHAVKPSTGGDVCTYSTSTNSQGRPRAPAGDPAGGVYVHGTASDSVYFVDSSCASQYRWGIMSGTSTYANDARYDQGNDAITFSGINGYNTKDLHYDDQSTSNSWEKSYANVTSAESDNGTVMLGLGNGDLIEYNPSGTQQKSTSVGGNARHLSLHKKSDTIAISDGSSSVQFYDYSFNKVITQSLTVNAPAIDTFSDGGKIWYAATGTDGSLSLHKTSLSATTGNPASDVSGTVTDSDGTAIGGATVKTGTGKSTTTASDGSYTLSLGDGTYDITASADGYGSQTNTVTVSGSAITGNDYSLPDTLSGTVETTGDTAVANAQVELWMVNDANTSTNPGETVEEAQEDLMQNVSRSVPRDTYNPDLDIVSDVLHSSAGGPAVLVHSPEQWSSQGELLKELGGYSVKTNSIGRGLSEPVTQLQPDEKYIYSCWNSDESIPEDDVDDSIDPGKTQSCNVTVEQIGPGNETIQTYTRESQALYKTGWPLTIKRHHGVALELPEGYYRVHAEGAAAQTPIRVGQPEDIPRTVHHNLSDSTGAATDVASKVQNKIDSGTLKSVTVSTDKNGEWSYAVPSGYSTVSITAFKGGELLSNYQDPTVADLRQEVERQNYNGSIYLSQSPKTVHPPANNVTIRVQEISSPTALDIESYLSRLGWLRELVDKEHYSELGALWTEPTSQLTESELRDGTANLSKVIEQNQQLQDRVNTLLAERSNGQQDYSELVSAIQDSEESNDPSSSELRDMMQAQQEAIANQQQTIAQLQEEISSNVEAGGEGEPSLLNMRVPFETGATGDGLSEDGTQVLVHWTNGTTSQMSPDYWSVAGTSSEDPTGGATKDYVIIEDYPLPRDSPGAQIEVVTANSDGVGGAKESVKNPAFGGELPSIDSFNANTLRPGPSDTVEISVNPSEQSSYKSLAGATVYHPNGSTVPATAASDTIKFTTSAPGTYTIRPEMEDVDGNTYVETLRVKAGEQDVSMPPSVRMRSGVTGKYALAADGVSSAKLTDSGDSLMVSAVYPDGSEKDSLHIYTGDALSGAQETLKVSTLVGDSQRTGSAKRVIIHSNALSDGSHTRRNGDPITTSGTAAGVVEHAANGTLIKTYSEADGSATIEINNNPGLLDNARWWVETRLPSNPLALIPTVPELPSGTPAGVLQPPEQELAAAAELTTPITVDITPLEAGMSASNQGVSA